MATININVTNASAFTIGRRGENEVTSIIFDYSAWLAEFGPGTVTLLVKRNTDADPYPVVLSPSEDNTAIWLVTSTDTAYIGNGQAEFSYLVDSQIKKSIVYRITVLPDIIGTPSPEPPDPYETWIDTLLNLAGETQQNAEAAAGSATAAETAQGKAEDAQEAAETAQGKAEDAQEAAETAQGKAEDAQEAAETAQGKAEAAQTAAETAEDNAEAAAAAAAQARTGAQIARAGAEAARDAILNLTADATIDANVGTPEVEVTVSTEDDHKVLDFAFKNLKGETGAQGETGPQGPAATVTVGTTTTGAAGSQASVNNSGTSGAAILNFTIPKGDKGDTGTAATVTVGTVATGAAGTDAAVTNSGTSSAAVLNFTIPKGADGDVSSASMASTYSSSATYAVGDYCWYNGQLYRCNTAITTAEAWTSGHWTAAKIAEDVDEIKTTVDDITVVDAPTNYIEISADTFLHESVALTKTYNADGTVQLSFTETANPVVFYRLSGLTNGKIYVLTFDLISGGLSSVSNQKVGIYSSGNSLQKTIATASLSNSKYTIQFTAESGNLAIMISLIYSSKSVTLGNFSLIEKDAVPRLYIDNDALSEIPVESLEEEAQVFINSKTLICDNKNLLDGVALSGNHYINGTTGANTATGSSYSSTDFIPVTAGEVYYWSKIINGYWAFYSSNSEETYVSGLSYQDSSTRGHFVVPNTAAYARFTVANVNISSAWISAYVNRQPTNEKIYALDENLRSYSDYPANPCDYNGEDARIFKKCLCVGDSLTSGVCNYEEGGQQIMNVAFPAYSYPTQLAKLLSCEVTNMGLAGKTTAQWYEEKASADLSGYDFAIIQLGVNDAIFNNGWTAEEETALGNIVTKLQAENNNIKIFVATTPPGMSFYGAAYDSVNAGIESFVSNLADTNVIFVNLAQYGHTIDELAYNAGHFTAYGYLRLAMDYKAFIGFYISTHKLEFKEVQFIGTNHRGG